MSDGGVVESDAGRRWSQAAVHYDGAEEIETTIRRSMRPEPVITVSQWADRYRILSTKLAAEAGRYRTSRAPFLRDVMDALSPTNTIRRVVFMKAAQVGATEAGNNWIGFIIHWSPAPVIGVWPTVDTAKKVSQQRIAPLIEDTNGAAIDLTGASVGANFWTIDQLPPVDLVAAGGGVSLASVNPALVLLTVPRSVTGDLGQQSVLTRIFPCRAQIYVVDTQGHRQTVQLVPFLPLRARDTDLPSAVAVLHSITAVLSPQGLAGPSGDLPPATEADTLAGLRDDVVITPATLRAALAAYLAGNPVDPPIPGTPGVLDFSDPANGGLLAALGILGAPFVPSASFALDFSSPANSGLLAVLGA
ncbi:MAG: phage terminase large subunit family protein [Janthinobacterium lividum]